MGAEHALQVRKPGKPQRLGEAHQGGSLHLGALGDAGGRAERHVVGMLQRERGRLAQTPRQRRLDLHQTALQRLEIGGGFMAWARMGPGARLE